MAATEALRTRLDTLQWDVNRLEAENRRLREEHPDESRVLTLEAELEQSKNEVVTLKDRVSECGQQLEAARTEAAKTADTSDGETQSGLAEQLEAERRASNELREALQRSESRESELTEALEEREATAEQRRQEEERQSEARELRYYRALEAERAKWEAREQRALAEADRLRRDNQEITSADYTTLTGQLEEASQRETHLKKTLCESENLVSDLERQLEESQTVGEELRAELDLMRVKVRRLERSTSAANGDGREEHGTNLPSSRLDVRAPTFRPTVHFSTVEEAETAHTSRATTTLSKDSTYDTELTPPSNGMTATTSTQAVVHAPTVVPSPISFSPRSMGTDPPTSVTNSQGTALPFTTGVYQGATTTLTPAGGVHTPPVRMPLTYPMMHPNLPQIPNFHGGDQRDGETFEDWWEHFEVVAKVAGWDENFKLIHLTAALRGNAKSFYRSCTSAQKSNYAQLVSALKKRFTPVKLTALQTQMFHSRRQGANESVDDYAQELRKLHVRAYSTATTSNPEAEKVGQIVLVNQFVSGLRSELQAKVVGMEGGMDEMVARARFEETKLRELTPNPRKTYSFKGSSGGNPHRPAQTSNDSAPPTQHSTPGAPVQSGETPKEQRGKKPSGVKCFRCGLEGHMLRNCPYRQQSREGQESRGGMKNLTPQELPGPQPTTQQQEIQQLREKLRQAELAEAIKDAGAMCLVESEPGARLGPIVFASVSVNGVSTEALVDTGSPATIISLEFVLGVLRKTRPENQTNEQWMRVTQGKFKDPDIVLKNYGGQPLDFLAQINLSLSRGDRQVNSVVLVRKGAPNDLLIGTDVQQPLGLSLIAEDSDGGITDLFSGQRRNLRPSTSKADEESPKRETQMEPEPAGKGEPDASPTGEKTQVPESSTPPVNNEVRLLQTVRVPAGRQKLIRATVRAQPGEGPLLFTPGVLSESLQMADSVVEIKDDQFVTLLLQNHGTEKLYLRKGLPLGTASPVGVLTAAGVHKDTGDSGDKDAQPAVGRLQTKGSTTLPEEGDVDGRIAELFTQLNNDFDHLAEEDCESVKALLILYADVFALDSSELGTTQLVTHSIHTGQHLPIKQQVRRTPFALRKKVDELVEEMLDQGVVEPSESPWASPIVLVQKKDGGVRFCVDYRKLNQITKLDEFPLPRIDDTLDLLAGSCHFSALDLASGYWQVAMDPESKEKTAFTTYAGLYQFRKMPFGLVNAPATFQRLMEVVLSGLARRVCVVYLDDVLVFGRTIAEHNANLIQVLQRLRRAGLRLKPKKCRFALKEVEYLGHVVSAKGVQTNPRKVTAVEQFPTPLDVKTLRSFLGLASYYRKFVPHFAKVAGPLHALTKKDVPFLWTQKCQTAFSELKKLLTSAPLLAFPDFTKPFVLETDASGAGLGAVLAQKQDDDSIRPIAYASRSLQPHERNYGITELEGLGVVWAVKHFRPYLYGHPCEVFTDHSALTSLLNTPQPSGKLARWGMAIQELDLKILHRSGRNNANADALSRSPLPAGEDAHVGETDGVLAALEPGETADQCDLPTIQRRDEELAVIIKYLETGILPPNEGLARSLALSSSQYALEDDVLYKVEQDSTLRVIPPNNWRENLFNTAHGGVFGAHLSDVKVHSELRRHYWWNGMRSDITRWTRGCLVCNSHSPGRAVRAPLTPIPVAGPFDRVGVDVIQFPRSYQGNQYAVVFVDYLTKWPEVYPVPDQSAATIANLLVREIVSRHGVPSEVLSDRGRAFLSGLLKEVQQLLGFKKVNTSAYHPQTDGLVERFNRTLTAMLAKTVERGGKDWEQKLPFVLFAYRASQQQSTLESPFFLLYGRDPRLPTDPVMSPEKTKKLVDLKEYGVELAGHMSEAWELARQCVRKAQRRQKECYDRKARPPNFRVGDRVFLFKPADKTGPARKFARPYHGPFRVIDMDVNTAKIKRVDRPEEDTVLVAVDRLRHCPPDVPNAFWPAAKPKQKKGTRRSHPDDRDGSTPQTSCPNGEDPDTDIGSSPTGGVDLTETEEGTELPAAPDALSSEGSEPSVTHEGGESVTDQLTATLEGEVNTSQDFISGELESSTECPADKPSGADNPKASEGPVEAASSLGPRQMPSSKWANRLRRRRKKGSSADV